MSSPDSGTASTAGTVLAAPKITRPETSLVFSILTRARPPVVRRQRSCWPTVSVARKTLEAEPLVPGSVQRWSRHMVTWGYGWRTAGYI